MDDLMVGSEIRGVDSRQVKARIAGEERLNGLGQNEASRIGVAVSKSIAGLDHHRATVDQRRQQPAVACLDRVVVRVALVFVGRFAEPSPHIAKMQHRGHGIDHHRRGKAGRRMEIGRAFKASAKCHVAGEPEAQRCSADPIPRVATLPAPDGASGQFRIQPRGRHVVRDSELSEPGGLRQAVDPIMSRLHTNGQLRQWRREPARLDSACHPIERLIIAPSSGREAEPRRGTRSDFLQLPPGLLLIRVRLERACEGASEHRSDHPPNNRSYPDPSPPPRVWKGRQPAVSGARERERVRQSRRACVRIGAAAWCLRGAVHGQFHKPRARPGCL